MKNSFYKWIIVCLFSCSPALADHPNEGQKTIDNLIAEALENSIELKNANAEAEIAKLHLKEKQGLLWPTLSLGAERGQSNLQNVQSENNSLYGLAQWNLYRGGGDFGEIDKARMSFEKAKLHRDRKFNQLKLEITKNYYDLIYALEAISIKEQAIKLNSEQRRMAQVRMQSGFTSKSDVLEFDLRESVLLSDLVSLKQDFQAKSRAMDLLLSRKLSTGSVLVSGHLKREKNELVRSEVIQKLLERNILLKGLELSLKELEAQAQIDEAKLSSRLNFEAKVGSLASDSNTAAKYSDYSTSLVFVLPLFSGMQSSNISSAVIQKRQLLANEIEAEKMKLVSEVNLLMDKAESYEQRLEIEELSLEKSMEYYKLTLDEYRRGLKNSPDVVGASERLLEVKIRNLEFRKDLLQAKLDILALTNQ
jgi:outer membrane protein